MQMGEFERPVSGTFAVKNEPLDEQDVEEENEEGNEDDKEDDKEDSSSSEDDAKENEEAAFITDKPSPDEDDESNM